MHIRTWQTLKHLTMQILWRRNWTLSWRYPSRSFAIYYHVDILKCIVEHHSSVTRRNFASGSIRERTDVCVKLTTLLISWGEQLIASWYECDILEFRSRGWSSYIVPDFPRCANICHDIVRSFLVTRNIPIKEREPYFNRARRVGGRGHSGEVRPDDRPWWYFSLQGSIDWTASELALGTGGCVNFLWHDQVWGFFPNQGSF